MKNPVRSNLYLFFLNAFLLAFTANAQWTPQTHVNTLVANLPTEDAHSEVLPDGRTWIAFWTNVSSPQNYQLRAQLLDTAGLPLLGANGVVLYGGTMSTYLMTWDTQVDASGNLLVGFTRTDGNNEAIVQKVSPSGVLLFGANGTNLGTGFDVKLLALPNGQTIVGYLPGDYGTLVKLSTTGTLVWTTPTTIYPASGTKTSIGEMAAMTSGTILVVFHDRGNFGINSTPYARRYNHGTGLPLWTGPVPLISGYTTTFNRRYDLVAQGDTAYFGFTAAGPFDFQGFIQRINPDGSLPWGSTGVNFMDQSVLYEMNLRLAYEDDSPFFWALCTMTTSAQQNTGESIQKIHKKTGARPLGVNAVPVFPIGTANRSHEGALRVINHQPSFVFSDGNSMGVFPKPLKLMVLNSVGLPALANPLPIATHATGVKSRVAFAGQFNGKAIATWVESRNGSMRPYAQRRGLSCPLPQSTASASATGLMVQFTGTTSLADSSRWYFGDGTWAPDTASSGQISHAYSGSGPYTACLVAYNACGTDSACVSVNPCPLFGGPWMIALGSTTLGFSAPAGADSVWADFGDGTQMGSSNPPGVTHTYSSNGTFAATAIAFSACRTDTVTQGIAVTGIGLVEPVKTPWNLYPQPVSVGQALRWLGGSDATLPGPRGSLVWTNAWGQTVGISPLEDRSCIVPALSSGWYTVAWTDASGTQQRAVVVVR